MHARAWVSAASASPAAGLAQHLLLERKLDMHLDSLAVVAGSAPPSLISPRRPRQQRAAGPWDRTPLR